MNTPIETTVQQIPMRKTGTRPNRRRTYIVLLAVWVFLVGGGIWGAKAYTDKLQAEIQAELLRQNEQQLAAMQADYQKQIADLKDSLTADMGKLQSKIDAVNELLSFTKDSASSKTDNSNQLYSQLAEVTKKLEDLKKQLDALQ